MIVAMMIFPTTVFLRRWLCCDSDSADFARSSLMPIWSLLSGVHSLSESQSQRS